MSDYGDNGGPPEKYVDPLGYVKFGRSIRLHNLVGFGLGGTPYSPAEAFMDLVMEAAYKSGEHPNGDAIIRLEPGQLAHSLSFLATRWRWSVKRVRTFLDKLERFETIDRSYGEEIRGRTNPRTSVNHSKTDDGPSRGRQSHVITIRNYSLYQLIDDALGQSSGRHPAGTGQASGRHQAGIGQQTNKGKELKERKEEEDSPPTPSGGEASDQAVMAAKAAEPERISADAEKLRKRAARKASKAQRIAENEHVIAEAFETYQKAADYFGLARCRNDLSPERKTRLLGRIEAVGGLENFKQALRGLAVQNAFTRFLRGKLPPKPGEQPFKLDIDTLLQTNGNLGDVLQRLLDQSAASAPARPAWDKWTDADWEREIRAHANGIWPTDKIGLWPSHPDSQAPKHVVAKLGLADAYNDNGIKKRG